MKNKILKTITTIVAIILLLTASALDSEGFTVNFICAGCLAWLVLFFIANRKRVINLW
jgi:hypothetical protein